MFKEVIKKMTLIFTSINLSRRGVNKALGPRYGELFMVKWYSTVIHSRWCAAPIASIVLEPHS